MKLGAWAWSSPILTPWPSPVLVVAPSCHPSPPLSSPVSSPPGPHTTSAGRHRAVVSFVPSSILTAILTTILTAVLTPRPSPRVLATAPREYRRCTSSSHRAVVVSPRSPPVRCDHACVPSCMRVRRRRAARVRGRTSRPARARRSKRPGKTHRDKYHESLRDVGGLYLAGSGQRQQ